MKQVTEEMGLHDEWYARARELKTPEELLAFVKELTEQYQHDYGTICHAVAAAAIGAAWTVERSPSGGITGFQAGAIMWEFITHWMSEYKGKPLRLVDYSKMLYPQYAPDFDTTISHRAQEYLRSEATRLLAEGGDHISQEVIDHWKSIAGGTI